MPRTYCRHRKIIKLGSSWNWPWLSKKTKTREPWFPIQALLEVYGEGEQLPISFPTRVSEQHSDKLLTERWACSSSWSAPPQLYHKQGCGDQKTQDTIRGSKQQPAGLHVWVRRGFGSVWLVASPASVSAMNLLQVLFLFPPNFQFPEGFSESYCLDMGIL